MAVVEVSVESAVGARHTERTVAAEVAAEIIEAEADGGGAPRAVLASEAGVGSKAVIDVRPAPLSPAPLLIAPPSLGGVWDEATAVAVVGARAALEQSLSNAGAVVGARLEQSLRLSAMAAARSASSTSCSLLSLTCRVDGVGIGWD